MTLANSLLVRARLLETSDWVVEYKLKMYLAQQVLSCMSALE